MKNLNFFKTVILTTVLNFISLQIEAHEVWLERDNNGPARVYLGEPGEPEVGSEIDKLAGSKVYLTDLKNIVNIKQENDHWQADIKGEGDVRLFSDSVWQPWAISESPWWKFWEDEKTRLQGAILLAKAGRSDTKAKLNFEFVPVVSNGDVFTAIFEGQPLTNQTVHLLSPSKKQTELNTDEKGQVSVKLDEKGRYILSSVHTKDVQANHSGKKVDSLMYISTLSFVAL